MLDELRDDLLDALDICKFKLDDACDDMALSDAATGCSLDIADDIEETDSETDEDEAEALCDICPDCGEHAASSVAVITSDIPTRQTGVALLRY